MLIFTLAISCLTTSNLPRFMEKEMATHFSVFAWRIPWTEEPDGLQSMGSQRVGHDWATNTQCVTHSPLFCWVFIFVLLFHKYVFLTSLLLGSAWPESHNSCLSGPPERSCPGSLEALEAGDSPGHSLLHFSPREIPTYKMTPCFQHPFNQQALNWLLLS